MRVTSTCHGSERARRGRAPQQADAQLVCHVTDGVVGQQRGQRVERVSRGVRHAVPCAGEAHQRARVERTQLQRVVVKAGARLRVRRQEDLEAAVQEKPLADGDNNLNTALD